MTKKKFEISGHIWDGQDIVPFGPGLPPVKWKGKPFPNLVLGSIYPPLEYSSKPSKWLHEHWVTLPKKKSK